MKMEAALIIEWPLIVTDCTCCNDSSEPMAHGFYMDVIYSFSLLDTDGKLHQAPFSEGFTTFCSMQGTPTRGVIETHLSQVKGAFRDIHTQSDFHNLTPYTKTSYCARRPLCLPTLRGNRIWRQRHYILFPRKVP